MTTFHDLKLPYLFPKAGPVREWITFELARSSAAVIATNADDNARLRVVAGERVRLIPIGSNISPEPPAAYDRARWRIQLGVAPSELLLSYFGFLNASKGAETLIRALVALPQARLLMVGGQVGASDPTNAAYLQSILALIDELGLAARVLWIGFTASEEVSANLLASDVCVLPYRDGASFRRGSLMAALAHQLPIVTTHPPVETAQPEGRPRLIDGENVLLVPPDDPSALAAAVAKLAVSPELRARLSAGARELSNSFSWDRIAQQHLALYDNLLQN